MTDSTGTSAFSYNLLGQLLSEQNSSGLVITYGYGNTGTLDTISYPGSRTVSYDFDAAGQMTSLTDWAANTTAFTWTTDGLLETQVNPNGVTQTRTHDLAGQTTSIVTAKGPITLVELQYEYDDAGQLVGETLDQDSNEKELAYTYDPLSQLASVGTTPAGAAQSLVQLDATPAGLLTETILGQNNTYNPAQQLVTSEPQSGPSTDYAYDARGSRISATVEATGNKSAELTTYGYDPAGMLSTVTTPTATVTYETDGRGLRQTRTEGATTADFVWSTAAGLPRLLSDDNHSYIYGPSISPIAQVHETSGTVQYLHADMLGTPKLLTNASGTTIGTTDFDAFGNVGSRSGTATTRFGFTGNWTDPTTELVHLRARDYDPASGQFLTVDPLVDSTKQPYAYAANNPLTRTDHSGLFWADVGSFLLGALDSVTAGGSSLILGAVVPGYNCFVEEHDDAFGSGQIVGEISSVVVSVALMATGVGAPAGLAMLGGRVAAKAAIKASTDAIAAAARTAVNRVGRVATSTVRRDPPKIPSQANSPSMSPSNPAPTCLNSFTASTPVLLADGSSSRIADLAVGQWVLATDPETGQTTAKPVISLIRHGGEHTMVNLTLEDGSTLTATDQHPIWETVERAFVDAIDLTPGDLVQSADGRELIITKVYHYLDVLIAYNIEVAGVHTYYAGRTPVLVHNSGPCKPMSVNQMNQAIKADQAPAGIVRVGKADQVSQQHAHFVDRSALNLDGSWRHGSGSVTNKQAEWLRQNGWTIP